MRKALLFAAAAAVVLSACAEGETDTHSTNSDSVYKDTSHAVLPADAEESSEVFSDGESSVSVQSAAYPQNDTESGETSSAAEPYPEPQVFDNYDPLIVMNGGRSFRAQGFTKTLSNSKLADCFDRLDVIAQQYGNTLAFSYQNVLTKEKISYNDSKQFRTCSTIKAPYVKSILESGIDLDDVIVKDKMWQGDIGDTEGVCTAENGTEFTAKELIEAAVGRSDNTAYYLLEQHYGWQVFNSLQYKIGANYFVGEDWIFTNADTEDMLRSYLDIYEYGESGERGEWLTQLMTKTDHDTQISRYLSSKYKVSHKYGSEFNEKIYNDCAIVYADAPFVLCIFSEQIPETEPSDLVFYQLAQVFDEINSLI